MEYTEFDGDFQFFFFRAEYPFLLNLVQKSKLFQLKFGTKTNWNVLNLMMFAFSFLCCEFPVRVNLVHKNETVSLSWNLVTKLIRMSWIRWPYSLFLFWTRKKPFFGRFCPKNPLGIWMLPEKSPSSLITGTYSQWFYLFFLWPLIFISVLT